MQKLLWLSLGGAIGTVGRAALSGLVQRLLGSTFPYGTLLVNVLGCFLFGAVASYADTRAQLSPLFRITVLTGFLGAFTTFSTYAFDTGKMLEAARWGTAAAHVAAQNVVGIACLLAGLALGRALGG